MCLWWEGLHLQGGELSFTLPITAYSSPWDLIKSLHILSPTETNKLESYVSGRGQSGDTLAKKEWVYLMVGNKGQAENHESAWEPKKDDHRGSQAENLRVKPRAVRDVTTGERGGADGRVERHFR